MIRNFISRNPFTNTTLKQFDFVSPADLSTKLSRMASGHEALVATDTKLFSKKLETIASLLEHHKKKYAELISTETGKPISESLMEVAKCRGHCQYYAKNRESMLSLHMVATEAKRSYVTYEPLGGVYVLVPFNFPLWLAFKPTISYLLAGNSVLLRSSDSTPLMGEALEELFNAAGFDSYEYQNVFSSPSQLEPIVSHQSVHGVSFCGSSRAGSVIASICGKYLKKAVLELGGCDPFLVLPDADITLAAQLAVRSRLANAGQVCFSAKRFIVHESLYESFKAELTEILAKVKAGDPLDPATQLGPLARADLLENLREIVGKSVEQGGKIVFQGKVPSGGQFFAPTVLEVTSDNVLCREEAFGPVFPLVRVKSTEDAVKIANDCQYGLGAVIVSEDVKRAEAIARKIQAGMVFINEVVKSDSRLPSGGIKNSGYGRECGKYGAREFTNVKTTYIANHNAKKK